MAHCIAYSEADRQKRFEQAVGEGKMIGTGTKLVAVFRALSAAEKTTYDVREVVDILQAGMVAVINDSLENPEVEE